MKYKNKQPLYIFNRENPQNSEPQNGPRSGLDYIALILTTYVIKQFMNCFIVFFNKTYIVFKENLPVTGRVLEEEKCKYFHNVDFKFKVILLHFVFTFFIIHQST